MQPVTETQLLQSVAAEQEVTQVSREENVWSDLQLLPAVSGRMHWLVELHQEHLTGESEAPGPD